MKKNKTIKIAELLPEGLSEASINKIAELVQSYINEETENIKKELTAQVFGYIELQKQEIKDHALKELNEENEVYRNANLMQEFKAVMALELREDDVANVKSAIEDENTQLKEELATLVEETKKLISENTKLKNTSKILEHKNVKLAKTGLVLNEQVKKLANEVKD